MQELLFDLPTKARSKRLNKAHIVDAGDGNGHFMCAKCGWDSGWVECTLVEEKKGIPCPDCNDAPEQRVHNKHHNTAPIDAVYIGRGSPWGNPFIVGRHGTREQVIERFKCEVLPKLDLSPLVGKDLVCYCHPKHCHGDAIIQAISKQSQ
ncbi:DUF4326 domain-containing protein [Flexibacterium corallicola]|uniref:DUF4326 domain-containing protein n=1 Tax=Flexibacterium corallicola TaxID=3037259 RepID=UPI00286F600C|nr:DUF4326 domain-containing protein [Pseudovibrio sp. M1P-2-3]